jgi:hypothetical protein
MRDERMPWENQAKEKGVPDTGAREVEMDWGVIGYVLKSIVRVAIMVLSVVIPAALLTAAWHLRGDAETSFIGFWALPSAA